MTERSEGTLILAAHGTRSPAGQAQVNRFAARLGRRRPGLAVRLAYVDVQSPRLASVTSVLDRPAVVVPLLLTTGHHVRVDIADAVRGTPAVATPPLGGPELIGVLAARIAGAGPADALVLAAAGSGDPGSRAEVAAVAARLGAHVGYASATREPTVPSVVARLRAQGSRRVVVASYLLVDGLFQLGLRTAGADAVTPPLITHPSVEALVLDRYDSARGIVPQPAA